MNLQDHRVQRSKAFPKFITPALAGMALLLFCYEFSGFASVHSTFADFRAFWCAGSAVMHGADPYRTIAISSCEHAAVPFGLYTAPRDVVVPAPLPPYALAFFAPLSQVQFPLAAVVWLVALVAALAASIELLARSLATHRALVAALFVLPATVLWLPFGEATPFALAGAAIAAYALQSGRYAPATAGLMLLAFEPHIAIGVWIAAALFVPRMRLTLAIAACVLLGVSFALGPAVPYEYAFRALPLHALAELPRPAQYSAAWVLHELGASAQVSLRAGAITSIVTLFAGLFAAVRLRRRWNDPSALVFVPMAAAVIGGTFVHASHIVFAIPLAAAIALREEGRAAQLGALACSVLAVPWLTIASQPLIGLAGVPLTPALVFSLGRNRRLALRSLFAASVFSLLLVAAQHAPAPPRSTQAFPFAGHDANLVSAAWGRYIWREQSMASVSDWLGKAPGWFALVLLIGSVRIAGKEPVVFIRVDQVPARP